MFTNFRAFAAIILLDEQLLEEVSWNARHAAYLL